MKNFSLFIIFFLITFQLQALFANSTDLVAEYHFEDENGIPKNRFCGENIFLDGSASIGEEGGGYMLHFRRKPINDSGDFSWTAGVGWDDLDLWESLEILDLTQIYNGLGKSFDPGYEYSVQLGLYNSSNSWESAEHTFKVTECCDIPFNGIYDLNLLSNNNVKFYTNPSIIIDPSLTNLYSFFWTFRYQNGTTSGSFEREPYIAIDCSNKVIKAELEITRIGDWGCSKTIIKNFRFGICGSSFIFGKSSNPNFNTDIKIYPNPTSRNLVFKGQSYNTGVIYNYEGKVVKSFAYTEEVELEGINDGILVVVLYDEKDNVIAQQKIIKKE